MCLNSYSLILYGFHYIILGFLSSIVALLSFMKIAFFHIENGSDKNLLNIIDSHTRLLIYGFNYFNDKSS